MGFKSAFKGFIRFLSTIMEDRELRFSDKEVDSLMQ